MPKKEFLENYPLYRGLLLGGSKGSYYFHNATWDTLRDLPKPAINVYCDKCKSYQTFNMVNEYNELFDRDTQTAGTTVRAQYVCSACRGSGILFFLDFYTKVFEEEQDGKKTPIVSLYVRKVGQNPAWEIDSDKTLEKLLGEHADNYKKGLVCESQNYGIGAYAYFRRITEDIIDSLLDSITDLVEPAEKAKYQKALEETKKEKITEKKIDLVKDLLPPALRPDGMNPLKSLHSALSAGMHDGTDEECMEQAEIIKDILVFLVNQILKNKEENRKFTESMKKLLDKKLDGN